MNVVAQSTGWLGVSLSDAVLLGSFMLSAAGAGFGAFGFIREGRERRKGDREEDESFEGRLDRHRDRIDALEKRNIELFEQMQKLHTDIHERDQKIEAQEKKIKEQQTTIEHQQGQIESQQSQIEQQQVEIQELKQQLVAVQNGNNTDQSSSEGPML